MAPDNTVAWNGRRLQIPPHPARPHFVSAKVRVHEYPDGELAIFHGPRCLARWQPGEDPTTLPQPRSKRKPLAPRPKADETDDDLASYPQFPQPKKQP